MVYWFPRAETEITPMKKPTTIKIVEVEILSKKIVMMRSTTRILVVSKAIFALRRHYHRPGHHPK
jgi:hypothetical protein